MSNSQTVSQKAKYDQLPPVNRLCEGFGVVHLLKDFPFYKAKTQQTEPLPKVQETNPIKGERKPPTYTEITILSKTKSLSVYARLDSKITHNMLSYEDWETLEKPQLKPIDESFESTLIGRVCIGSFIVKANIPDQMRYCHFYVANKTKLQEGAIISLSWLSKTKPLFEPESQESPKVTKTSFKTMESKKVETPKNAFVTSPKPQPTTNLPKPPQESKTKPDI